MLSRDLFLRASKREGHLHKCWCGATQGRFWKVWSTFINVKLSIVTSKEATSCAIRMGISSWLTLGVPNRSVQ